MVMVCPYRKEITSDIPRFKDGNGMQSIEQFPQCQGDICPLYNPHLPKPCSRAMKERNEAYMLIKAENIQRFEK